jgi:hypothetical protein
VRDVRGGARVTCPVGSWNCSLAIELGELIELAGQ